MNKIEMTKKLFDWNKINLVSAANLNKNEIGNFFASHFKVKANGRDYDANWDNYYEFLNRFRADIQSISYILGSNYIFAPFLYQEAGHRL